MKKLYGKYRPFIEHKNKLRAKTRRAFGKFRSDAIKLMPEHPKFNFGIYLYFKTITKYLAYLWLSEQLRRPMKCCLITRMSSSQCRKVLTLCQKETPAMLADWMIVKLNKYHNIGSFGPKKEK